MNPFHKAFTDSRLQARASLHVVPLHDDMAPEARVRVALESLQRALMNLEWMKEASPKAFTPEQMETLDKAGEKFTFLRAELRMKHSTVQLCSKFGRPV